MAVGRSPIIQACPTNHRLPRKGVAAAWCSSCKGGEGLGGSLPLAKACVLAAPPCGCIQLGKVSVRCDCAAN